MKLAVRVIPNAPRTRITGKRGDEIILRVSAPATGGRANRAAMKHLAQKFGVSSSRVRLIAGARSRHKKFEIVGLGADSDAAVVLLSDDA